MKMHRWACLRFRFKLTGPLLLTRGYWFVQYINFCLLYFVELVNRSSCNDILFLSPHITNIGRTRQLKSASRESVGNRSLILLSRPNLWLVFEIIFSIWSLHDKSSLKAPQDISMNSHVRVPDYSLLRRSMLLNDCSRCLLPANVTEEGLTFHSLV